VTAAGSSWHIRRNPPLLILAWWVPHLLMSDGYDPIDYVARIAPRPILIMHGTHDHVAHHRMGQRLYAAAGEPKELWLIDGADHYEAMQEMVDETHPRLLSFFARCVDHRHSHPIAESSGDPTRIAGSKDDE
jgi:fermentation-respiration switch protein FrsA (DUF1100 family)